MASKVNIPITPSGAVSNVDAFDKFSDWIRSPDSFGPAAGAIGRAGQKYCDILGSLPGAQSGIFGPTFAAGNLMCEPYWDEKGYDGPVPEPPPFDGGQCAGIPYEVRVTRSGAIIDFNQVLIGPIGAFTYERTGSPNFRLIISISHQGGVATSDVGDPGDAAIETYVQTVARTDSSPDNCGDVPTPPEPGANPPPVPTFPPGQEPGVGTDGQPFFYVPPIDSPVGGDPVDVPDPGADGGGADGGGPTEPPVAGGEEDGGQGDEEFPPPEDGRRWVGCCIRLTSLPPGTGTVPNSSPGEVLTQVVGNVRLLFDSVTGSGYDTPVQIRSVGVCLWEPVKGLSPTGVRVNLKPGFTYTYTPYSVKETE